jgi:O-acetylhomoserine/O-acetylserine sulfhydrylase-like pyridoxal-dependent enzyme
MSRPLGLPVVRSSTFAFDNAHDYVGVLNGRIVGYSYSRIDNPISAAFAAAVAVLEVPGCNDVGAEPFASGMAPSVICWPLEHGADLVLHSATKFLGGCLAPDEAFLLHRGLEAVALTTPLSRRPE